jgi:hypothetical protein
VGGGGEGCRGGERVEGDGGAEEKEEEGVQVTGEVHATQAEGKGRRDMRR